MEQYLIHTCNKRKWYVDEFLIPSMRKQGIENILVYNDEYGEGQIPSLIKSYELIGDEDTWHLQDDIIISKKFKEITERRKEDIVCGFCNGFSVGQSGYVGIYSMWYSMPCIRISGAIFKHFISWLNTREVRKRLDVYFRENKHDDVFLEIFLKEYYPKMLVWNLAPNIVNHIDHLIGGSLINKDRNKDNSYIMSKYWDEPELLDDIEKKLKERRASA